MGSLDALWCDLGSAVSLLLSVFVEAFLLKTLLILLRSPFKAPMEAADFATRWQQDMCTPRPPQGIIIRNTPERRESVLGAGASLIHYPSFVCCASLIPLGISKQSAETTS